MVFRSLILTVHLEGRSIWAKKGDGYTPHFPVAQRFRQGLKLYILASCAIGAVALYGITPSRNYSNRPYFRDGVQYMSATRLNDPTLDQEAEAKAIADYVHKTEVYQNLPKVLKEKLDRNQKNYFMFKNGLEEEKKHLWLYSDTNVSISYYGSDPQTAQIKIDMNGHPESIKGYVMASYEPSKAVDKKTGKPYFWVPERILKQISTEERAYFETFLDVVNENYHFLTAYPLLQVEPQKFKDGEYWAKFVPAQYLVTNGSVPKPKGYQPGLKDDIQTRLGAPVYDLSEMKVTYDYSDCSEFNYRGKLQGVKGVSVGFFRYNPEWTADEIQIRVFHVQTGVRRVSLNLLKQGLEEEYQIRKDSFSKEADFIYRKLKGMITEKVDVQLEQLPKRGLSTHLYNLPKYAHLKHQPAVSGYGDQTQKIRAE
ncbi:MAG: hypothetical protein ACI4QJ_02865 [Candidatus Spyradenecus sp.]